MAEERNSGEEAGKGRRTMLIVAAVVLVLAIAGGAGAFFLMDSGSQPAPSAAATQDATVATVEPIVYVNIAQPFIFNVVGDKRDRMVQIKVQLMVRGAENDGLAQYHSPLIESSLLSTFASATVEQLRSATGRTELRDKATGDVRAALTQSVGLPVIEKVLFTDFVIQ